VPNHAQNYPYCQQYNGKRKGYFCKLLKNNKSHRKLPAHGKIMLAGHATIQSLSVSGETGDFCGTSSTGLSHKSDKYHLDAS